MYSTKMFMMKNHCILRFGNYIFNEEKKSKQAKPTKWEVEILLNV